MPYYSYIQNRLATSSFLLPVATCISIVLWLCHHFSLWQQSLPLAISILSVYLLAELNNGFVLLRIRSRSISSVLCIILGYSQFVHTEWIGLLTMLCLLVSYHLLFHAYQDRQAMAKAFGCYLCLGFCCLLSPLLIGWVLPFLIAFAVFQALSLRSFCAMLVGWLLPFLFLATYSFLMDEETLWLERLTEGIEWNFSEYGLISTTQLIDLAFLVVMMLMAIIHYFRYSYQDKIKTRTYLSFLSWMCIWITLQMVCLPQYFTTLYLALCVSASPLIGHCWTFTSGKWSNRLFCLTLLLVAGLAAWNVWMP